MTSAMLAASVFPGLVGALPHGLGADSFAAGQLVRMEQSTSTGQGTCDSWADGLAGRSNCSNVNLFAGAGVMTPGRSSTTTTVFTNTGSVAAGSLAVAAGACTQDRKLPSRSGGNTPTDLCDRISVRLDTGGVAIFDGSAADFGRAGAIEILGGNGTSIDPGHSVAVSVTLTLSGDVDNSYQGLRIVQPVSWTFGQ